MKINFKAFRKDFKDAVKDLEASYGIEITMGNITYNDESFRFKTMCNNLKRDKNNNIIKTSKEDKRKEFWDKNWDYYGVGKDWLNKTFTKQGKTFEVVGLTPRKLKYRVIIKDIRTNKEFKATVLYINLP